MSDMGKVYSVSIIDGHPLYGGAPARVMSEQVDTGVVQVMSTLSAFTQPPDVVGGVVIVDCPVDSGRDVGLVQAVSAAGNRVLVLSAADQPADVPAALDAGGDGYIGNLCPTTPSPTPRTPPRLRTPSHPPWLRAR